MDDRLALMAAIVANPDEDTPRLAFADWLQEHGDEHDRARADLIRLQIEYAPLKIGSAARRPLQRRAATIQKKHAAHWLGPLAGFVGETGFPDEDRLFERGLLQWWMTPARKFLQSTHQKALCEWLPRVGANRLFLEGVAAPPKQVAASAALAWFPEIVWEQGKVDDAGLTALAASPHLRLLSTFGLYGTTITDSGLAKLAAARTMPNLRRVQFESGKKSAYTAAGVLGVVGSKQFPKLEALDLDCEQPKSLDYAALLADPRLRRLKRLRLGWKCDAAAAVRSHNLTGLEELGLNEPAAFTPADADALLANPALAGLKRFSVEGSDTPGVNRALVKKLRARFGEGLHIDMV